MHTHKYAGTPWRVGGEKRAICCIVSCIGAKTHPEEGGASFKADIIIIF